MNSVTHEPMDKQTDNMTTTSITTISRKRLVHNPTKEQVIIAYMVAMKSLMKIVHQTRTVGWTDRRINEQTDVIQYTQTFSKEGCIYIR